MIARALASDPRVLLLNDPTRGVDIGAKRDIYALLRELAADGMAIVMLSTEVDEHLELMDRVLVFRDGRPAAELQRRDLSRSSIVGEFFGRATPEIQASRSTYPELSERTVDDPWPPSPPRSPPSGRRPPGSLARAPTATAPGCCPPCSRSRC